MSPSEYGSGYTKRTLKRQIHLYVYGINNIRDAVTYTL